MSAVPSTGFTPWPDRALATWLSELRNRYLHLAMLGLPDPGDHKDVSVKDLYVGQNVRIGGSEPVSLARALVDHPRLAVLGEAGTGKSTLLHWLVVQFTGWEDTWMTNQVGRLVPLPILLRDVPLTADVRTFEALLDALPSGRGWEPALRAALPFEEGHVWVMVDGLDEVTSSVRDAVREALADGMRRYPECRFVVTSRPLGWTDAREIDPKMAFRAPHALAELPEARLEPFTDEQIRAYAERWYTMRVGDKERAKERTADLLAVLARDPHIGGLARNPSLLTLVLIVHRSATTLPSGRAVLYDKIVEAYLEAIDRARRIQTGPVPPSVQRRRLSALALHMQKRRIFGEGDGDGVVIRFEEAVAAIAEPGSEPDAAALLRAIAERSGLLTPRTNGTLSFTHLSFQDYFAARWFADELRLAYFQPKRADAAVIELRGWAAKPAARETLVFLFESFADAPGMGDGLVARLFAEPAATYEGWDGTGGLAQALVDDAGSGLGPEGRAVAQARVDEATRAIASSKKFLPAWVRSIECVPLTAESLAMANCHRLPTSSLLGRSALRFLAIQIHTAEDLAFLQHTPNLYYLGLASRIPDISAIRGRLPHAESLVLGNLSDSEWLGELPLAGPSSLGLLGDASTAIRAPSLKSLEIGGNDSRQSSACLADLPQLIRLSLSRVTHPDLTPLPTAAPNVTDITIEDCPNLTDLSPIAALRGPGKVTLKGATGIPADHPPRMGNFEIIRQP